MMVDIDKVVAEGNTWFGYLRHKDELNPQERVTRDLLAAIEQGQKGFRALDKSNDMFIQDILKLEKRVAELESEVKDAEERRAAAVGWYDKWHDANERVAELEEAARSLLNRASRPLNLGEILLQQALNGKDGD